jgi:RimJ/RimL family protein N-acetyltransferase
MLEGPLDDYSRIGETDFFNVVYHEGKLIGFHIAHVISSGSGRIVTLWVHPDHRSKGLAKTLKEQGIAWARASGIKKIYTSVNPNNKRMLAINEKNGFKVTAVEMCLTI